MLAALSQRLPPTLHSLVMYDTSVSLLCIMFYVGPYYLWCFGIVFEKKGWS